MVKFSVIFVVLSVFILFFVLFSKVNNKLLVREASQSETFVKQEKVFTTYKAPIKEVKSKYKIVMVGDSMTHALGPHGGTFSDFINNLYSKYSIVVEIDNYAKGATNLFDLKEQMNSKTTYWDSTFEPLMQQDFDLILIESFGYNPLSHLGIVEGLKKQNEILLLTMDDMTKKHPNAAIVFVATISPNKETYAKKVQMTLTIEERVGQAEERIAYIKNHIQFAKDHNIPIIDIYSKSLDENGNGKIEYINPDDNIHPSFEGVDFIGHEIASYIFDHKILPY